MQLPSVRLTIRPLMIAVGMVALVLALESALFQGGQNGTGPILRSQASSLTTQTTRSGPVPLSPCGSVMNLSRGAAGS
jgi:hypothetical protein